MTTALDRARALLDTPPPTPIPGQLAVPRRDPDIGPTHHALNVLAHAMATTPGPWDTDRAHTLLRTAGCDVRRDDAWGLLRYLNQRTTTQPAPEYHQPSLWSL